MGQGERRIEGEMKVEEKIKKLRIVGVSPGWRREINVVNATIKARRRNGE